jgi:hypothetical protein
MARLLKCNSCGGTYPDTRDGKTVAYFHACPDEVIETHAACDEKGNVVTPAKYKPVENPRNENLKRHPEKPGEFVMVSEGNGVTEID